MFLKLLESRRARHFAGGALAASVGVHLGFAGAATRPPTSHEDRPEPISVRYLIPPDQPRVEVEERINWAAIGPGTSGWDARTASRDGLVPAPGGDELAQATRPTKVPVLAEDTFQLTMTYQEYEVDSAAARDPSSGGPTYPDELRLQGVQGEVLVEFAVDTTGHADSATFHVVEATHPQFADAVREALPRMLFTPAVARGRRVRQLVRLPMKFKLLTETAAQGTT
jgi:TonB family protein